VYTPATARPAIYAGSKENIAHAATLWKDLVAKQEKGEKFPRPPRKRKNNFNMALMEWMDPRVQVQSQAQLQLSPAGAQAMVLFDGSDSPVTDRGQHSTTVATRRTRTFMERPAPPASQHDDMRPAGSYDPNRSLLESVQYLTSTSLSHFAIKAVVVEQQNMELVKKLENAEKRAQDKAAEDTKKAELDAKRASVMAEKDLKTAKDLSDAKAQHQEALLASQNATLLHARGRETLADRRQTWDAAQATANFTLLLQGTTNQRMPELLLPPTAVAHSERATSLPLPATGPAAGTTATLPLPGEVGTIYLDDLEETDNLLVMLFQGSHEGKYGLRRLKKLLDEDDQESLEAILVHVNSGCAEDVKKQYEKSVRKFLLPEDIIARGKLQLKRKRED
jgi:hypothetical protein